MSLSQRVKSSLIDLSGFFNVLRKGQKMGVPSLNDLAVDGTLNTTNQPTSLIELPL